MFIRKSCDCLQAYQMLYKSLTASNSQYSYNSCQRRVFTFAYDSNFQILANTCTDGLLGEFGV